MIRSIINSNALATTAARDKFLPAPATILVLTNIIVPNDANSYSSTTMVGKQATYWQLTISQLIMRRSAVRSILGDFGISHQHLVSRNTNTVQSIYQTIKITNFIRFFPNCYRGARSMFTSRTRYHLHRTQARKYQSE